MSLFFALGFLAFAFLGFSAAKDASKYHNEYVGIGVNGIAGCMSVLAMLFCLCAFIFIELPIYGIMIWNLPHP